MTGLEKIKDGILAEATEAVKAALEEAKTRAVQIEDLSRAESEKTCTEISRKTENQLALYKERTKSAIDLERSMKLLETKQNIIAEVIEKAKLKLKDLSSNDYFDVLAKIADKAIHAGEGKLFLSASDLERMPDDFVKKIKAIAEAKEALIEISNEPIEIDDGFVLSYGGIEENCTFDAIFAEKKDELSDIAQKTLFQ